MFSEPKIRQMRAKGSVWSAYRPCSLLLSDITIHSARRGKAGQNNQLSALRISAFFAMNPIWATNEKMPRANNELRNKEVYVYFHL